MEIVHADFTYTDQFGYPIEKIHRKKFNKVNRVITGSEYIKECMRTASYELVIITNLIKKSYLLDNNIMFINGLFYEDHDYNIRLFSNDVSVVVIDYQFYFYRRNRLGSTTSSFNLRKANDIVDITIYIINYLERAQINRKFRRYYFQSTSLAYYHLVRNIQLLSETDIKAILIKQRSINKSYILFNPYKNLQITVTNLAFILSPRIGIAFTRLIGKLRRQKT